MREERDQAGDDALVRASRHFDLYQMAVEEARADHLLQDR